MTKFSDILWTLVASHTRARRTSVNYILDDVRNYETYAMGIEGTSYEIVTRSMK